MSDKWAVEKLLNYGDDLLEQCKFLTTKLEIKVCVLTSSPASDRVLTGGRACLQADEQDRQMIKLQEEVEKLEEEIGTAKEMEEKEKQRVVTAEETIEAQKKEIVTLQEKLERVSGSHETCRNAEHTARDDQER